MLVVEDNSVVADAVAEGLRDQGMAVDVAYDGPSGLEKAVVNTYDVVVLDRDLPGLHGDKLCEPDRRLAMPEPGTDADRRRAGRGPGRGAEPGRRRLPGQAVRLLRAGRPGAGPRPPQPVHTARADPR